MTAKKEREKMAGRFFIPLLGPGVSFGKLGNQEYILTHHPNRRFFRVSSGEGKHFWDKVFESEIFFDEETEAILEKAADKGLPVQFKILAGPQEGKYQWARNIEPVGEKRESTDVADVELSQIESPGDPKPLTELFV